MFVVNVWGLPPGQHYVYHVSNITKNGHICDTGSGPYGAGSNVVLWNGTHYKFSMNYTSAAAYGMSDWLGASLNGWMETVNCTKDAHCNCTQCGQPVGHTWTWQHDSNATCTTNGTQHQHCSVCGANRNYGSVWQNAFGHNDNKKWVTDKEPTCTTTGLKHTNCTRCNTVLNKNTSIPAFGHIYDTGKITTYPTVYREGVRTYTCSRCSDTKNASEPQYHFNINVGYTPIKKIAKGNNLLFENTSMDADLIPFVSK